MRVISESTFIDTVQFMHLGYLSVTVADPPIGDAASFGLTGFVALVAGVMVTRRFWGRSHVKAAGGVVLALLGIAALVSITFFSHRLGWWKYRNPDSPTRTNLRYLSRKIDQFRKEKGYPPKDEWALQRDEVFDEHIRDGWKRLLRISRITVQGRSCYAAVSAGEDGKFGTSDDRLYGTADDGNVLEKYRKDKPAQWWPPVK